MKSRLFLVALSIAAIVMVSSCQVSVKEDQGRPTRHVFLSKLQRQGQLPTVQLDQFGQPSSVMSIAPLGEFPVAALGDEQLFISHFQTFLRSNYTAFGMRSASDYLQLHVAGLHRLPIVAQNENSPAVTLVTLRQSHSGLPVLQGEIALTIVDGGLVSISGSIYSRGWLNQRLRRVDAKPAISRKQAVKLVKTRAADEPAARTSTTRALPDPDVGMVLAIDPARGRVVYTGVVNSIRYVLDAHQGIFLYWEELSIPQTWDKFDNGLIRAPQLPTNLSEAIAYHSPGDPTQLYTDALIDRKELENSNTCRYRLSYGQGEDGEGRSEFPFPTLREFDSTWSVNRERDCNVSPFTIDDFDFLSDPGIPNANFRQNFHYYYLMHAARTALTEDARLYAFIPPRRPLSPQVEMVTPLTCPSGTTACYKPGRQMITFKYRATDRRVIFHEYGHFVHHTYTENGGNPYGNCRERGLTEGIAQSIDIILKVTGMGVTDDVGTIEPNYENVNDPCDEDQYLQHSRGFALGRVLGYLLANRRRVCVGTFTSTGGGGFSGGAYTYDSPECEMTQMVTDGVPSDPELAAIAKESFTYALYNTATRADVTLHEFLQWMAFYYRILAYDYDVLDQNEWAMLMIPFLDQGVDVSDFGALFDLLDAQDRFPDDP